MVKNWIIGSLFFAVAVFFTYAVCGSALRQNDAHERFRPVTAHVVSSRVVSSTSGTGSARTRGYRPDITYRYTVGGQEYTSRVFQFMGPGHSSYDSAEAAADAYPAGGTVQAYYDPDDPSVAVLDRSPIDTTVLLWAAIAIWSVIIGTCIYAVRRRRARRRVRRKSAPSEA